MNARIKEYKERLENMNRAKHANLSALVLFFLALLCHNFGVYGFCVQNKRPVQRH